MTLGRHALCGYFKVTASIIAPRTLSNITFIISLITFIVCNLLPAGIIVNTCWAILLDIMDDLICAPVVQRIECDVADVEVGGSTPSGRTIAGFFTQIQIKTWKFKIRIVAAIPVKMS